MRTRKRETKRERESFLSQGEARIHPHYRMCSCETHIGALTKMPSLGNKPLTHTHAHAHTHTCTHTLSAGLYREAIVTMLRFTLIPSPEANTYLSKPAPALKTKLSCSTSFLPCVITLHSCNKERRLNARGCNDYILIQNLTNVAGMSLCMG